MYIILEYYLLENFLLNFLVLYSTNMITKSKIKIKGIIMGTMFSTAYSLIIFLPSLLFLSKYIFKILISVLIVYITFRSKNLKLFFYQWLCFYIVSFIFAGAIMSLSSSFTNIRDILAKEFNLFQIFGIRHIIIGVLIAIIISIIVFGYNYKKKQIEKLLVEAKITIKDHDLLIKALVDTGNTLKEPLSNRSVFIVELSKLMTILPEELIDFYKNRSNRRIEDLLIDLSDDLQLTLVPFKSIGNDNGIILGFKPDSVIVKQANEEDEIILSNIIIGIYDGNLSSENDFSGLLDYESILRKEEI